MKVLVSGGRDYGNWKKVHETLDMFHKRYGITKIIHGAAKGADFHASTWAVNNKVPHTGATYVPDWDGLGKSAGIKRNVEMFHAEVPDIVIGFPGDRGTKHMTEYAAELGCATLIVPDPLWKPLDFSALTISFKETEELDDALADEAPPWKVEEPTAPYWLCPPTKKWTPRSQTAPTPTDRYDSMF